MQWGPCPPLGREAATCRALRLEQRSFAYHPGWPSGARSRPNRQGVAIPRPTRPLHRPLSARLAHGTREHGIIEHLADGHHQFLGLAPCHQYLSWPCDTYSAMPPLYVETTGAPHARASNVGSPMARSRPTETPQPPHGDRNRLCRSAEPCRALFKIVCNNSEPYSTSP